MSAPFAAIETATARNAVAALANATAVIGGRSIDGMFDNGYAEVAGIVAGLGLRFACASEELPAAIAEGDSVTIANVSYTVSQPPQADGTGMTVLQLHEA